MTSRPAIRAAATPGLMTSPRLLGVDGQRQPFQLLARSAQQLGSSGDISLQDIAGSLLTREGGKAALQAAKAYYDHQTRKVYLLGSVQLKDGRGHALSIEDLAVDMRAKTALTTGAVSGQTPQGAIQAQGLEVRDQGKRLIFKGPSSLEVQDRAASAPDEKPILRLQ